MQLDTIGRKISPWSDERRRTQAERMRARWADPEFCEKRAAASRKAIKDKWTNHREEAMRSIEGMKYSPKRAAWLRNRLKDPQRLQRHRDHLDKLNSDPDIKERRIAALRRKFADPSYRKTLVRAQDKRRGFRIPPQKRGDYEFLRKSKGFTAREAGQILGLI